MWVVWIVLNKFVYLFGLDMTSEKLKRDEENENKTDSREGVCKQLNQHLYDILRQQKLVTVAPEKYQ